MTPAFGSGPEHEVRQPVVCRAEQFECPNVFALHDVVDECIGHDNGGSRARDGALHFLYYNFVRLHHTLRATPAVAAGVTKRLWEMGDVVDVLEARESSNA
jgi:hypothetical protein